MFIVALITQNFVSMKKSNLVYNKVSVKDDGADDAKKAEMEKRSLSAFELLRVLRPYFWPNAGSDGAFPNRVRAVSTWLTVIVSKFCSLYAPFFLAAATNYLVDGKFHTAAIQLTAYCLLRMASTFFKELQSIIYVKVKQVSAENLSLQKLIFTFKFYPASIYRIAGTYFHSLAFFVTELAFVQKNWCCDESNGPWERGSKSAHSIFVSLPHPRHV